MSERHEILTNSLQAADDWRAKGDERWECTCLEKAVDAMLLIAVAEHDDIPDAIDSLKSADAATTIARIFDLNAGFFQALLDDPKGKVPAVSNDIIPVHVSWLLGEFDLTARVLAICVDGNVSKRHPLTKFWQEYYRAIECLSRLNAYEPDLPKTKGYEKYWLPYLSLVSDLVQNRDITDTIVQLDELFAKRNKDRRLTDWKGHDGDGNQPVRWDFRKASILRFAESHDLVS